MLGAPGAGKGTQAQRLSVRLSFPHVATGNLLRENIEQRTELGVGAGPLVRRGQLVPDQLVVDMLFDRVGREDCREGYLLDGFPRNVPQAEELDRRFESGTQVQALNLEVPDPVIVQRVAGRRVCGSCGEVRRVDGAGSPEPGACDVCGGELRQREDDRPEVVSERLAVYREHTAPVVDFYREKEVLCEVNGDQSPDAVFADCMGCLEGSG